eukprot:1160404-Pelagomonas_calceolata.AAC.1
MLLVSRLEVATEKERRAKSHLLGFFFPALVLKRSFIAFKGAESVDRAAGVFTSSTRRCMALRNVSPLSPSVAPLADLLRLLGAPAEASASSPAGPASASEGKVNCSNSLDGETS